MIDFHRWGQRARLLVMGSADPFATRKGTACACVGIYIYAAVVLGIFDLIFNGRVAPHLLLFPLIYAVVFPLIMRRRRRRRS